MSFASAIIVFREMLEIVLIVGLITAATKGLRFRNALIASGIGAGVALSALVAFFADSISEMADGVGQEIFNASIMLLAAGVVSWTVIWMQRHARELGNRARLLGEMVISGEKPLYTIAIMIGLSVLREGTEMVLFIYGKILAENESIASIAIGSVVGGVMGAFIGVIFYYGILKMAKQRLFKITTWMLVFLCAGMAAQGAQYLVAADVLPVIAAQAWDSSWLLADDSAAGQAMHSLIGYSAKPSGMQLLFFIGTLFMVSSMLLRQPKHMKLAKVVSSVMLTFAITLSAGSASASYSIKSPTIEEGELEFDFKNSTDFNGGKTSFENSIGVGYGLSSRWFSELELEFEKESHDNYKAMAFTLESRWLFAEPGQNLIDSGIVLELEKSLQSGYADKVEAILMLQKNYDKFVHTANLILEQAIGENSHDEGVEGGIQWSSKYRLDAKYQPGIEYYADFGELKESEPFSQQKHLVGPVLSGKISNVKYSVGVLAGISDAAPDAALKWNFELEF